MCPSSLCEGPFCWFLVLFSCGFRWFLGWSTKLLLFGTFCLILYGRWAIALYSQYGYIIWDTAVWTQLFVARYLLFMVQVFILPIPGFIKVRVWGLVLVVSSFWWSASSLLGSGMSLCTGYVNWVRHVLEFVGVLHQFQSRAGYQVSVCYQGMYILVQEYVLSAGYVSPGLDFLFVGREYMFHVYNYVAHFSWIINMYLQLKRPIYSQFLRCWSEPHSSSSSISLCVYFVPDSAQLVIYIEGPHLSMFLATGRPISLLYDCGLLCFLGCQKGLCGIAWATAKGTLLLHSLKLLKARIFCKGFVFSGGFYRTKRPHQTYRFIGHILGLFTQLREGHL